MRTLKSIVAALMTAVIITCLSVSAFADTYEDVSEMYPTTLDDVIIDKIKFVDALGIISSEKNGNFNPTMTISRGEALKIAYRMLHYDYDELKNYQNVNTDFDETNGGDVTDVDLLKPYIAWGIDYGFVNAQYVEKNQFKATQDITGAEFITLIAKVLGLADQQKEAAKYEEPLSLILDGSNVTADSTSINKEQAASIVYNAMLYDPADGGSFPENTEIFTYDGVRFNCLATTIYGCNNTELTIRATKQKPMDYDNVTKDMLLSNGVQVDTGTDMSSFIGYSATVLYLDKDDSDTFTQDEELLSYTLLSPWVYTASLKDVKVASYNGLTSTATQDVFSIYANTQLYLNDRTWPSSAQYKLTNLIDFVNFSGATAITNRPNLNFKFIKTGSAENADVVLATEWIPGKVMTVTDNYYAIYSYYDSSVLVYEDNDILFSGVANLKSGDIVNYYVSGSKLYVSAGTTARLDTYKKTIDKTTSVESIVGKTSGVDKEKSFIAHYYENKNVRPFDTLVGPVNAILDSTGTSYLALEEAKNGNEISVQIVSVTENSDKTTANVAVRELKSGSQYTMTVDIDRISSTKGTMNAGDYFTYYKTVGGKVDMFGVDPVKMNVVETADYFITDGGQKYLKAEGFVSDSNKMYSGKVTLMIDHYDGVWAVYGA